MTIDYKVIGKRIKELRLEKSLTQEKLAEICNLSISHISLIESGKRNASLDTLIKLGNNLGVTVDKFLKGYQKNDLIVYKADFANIFEDCSYSEEKTIFEIATIAKKSIRNNFLTTCQNFDM